MWDATRYEAPDTSEPEPTEPDSSRAEVDRRELRRLGRGQAGAPLGAEALRQVREAAHRPAAEVVLGAMQERSALSAVSGRSGASSRTRPPPLFGVIRSPAGRFSGAITPYCFKCSYEIEAAKRRDAHRAVRD